MKFVIETARHQHRVKDEPTLQSKHAEFIAKLASGGSAVQIHSSATPMAARVNHGIWVFDCDCGAGVAADHGFSSAYCFGCGAIYPNVVWPTDRADIEQALLARPKSQNRNWNTDETLADLLAENAENGVPS